VIADLQARPLTIEGIMDLAPVIREEDLLDLKCQNSSAFECLMLGLEGHAWGIYEGDLIVGAGGFTAHGFVWSLWRDMTEEQKRGVMQKAVGWARIMRLLAGKALLQNVYLKGNHKTERFLKATRCVTIDEGTELVYQGRTFIPFFLKPYEELPNV